MEEDSKAQRGGFAHHYSSPRPQLLLPSHSVPCSSLQEMERPYHICHPHQAALGGDRALSTVAPEQQVGPETALNDPGHTTTCLCGLPISSPSPPAPSSQVLATVTLLLLPFTFFSFFPFFSFFSLQLFKQHKTYLGEFKF